MSATAPRQRNWWVLGASCWDLVNDDDGKVWVVESFLCPRSNTGQSESWQALTVKPSSYTPIRNLVQSQGAKLNLPWLFRWESNAIPVLIDAESEMLMYNVWRKFKTSRKFEFGTRAACGGNLRCRRNSSLSSPSQWILWGFLHLQKNYTRSWQGKVN